MIKEIKGIGKKRYFGKVIEGNLGNLIIILKVRFWERRDKLFIFFFLSNDLRIKI